MVYEKISGFSDEIDAKVDVQFATLNKLGIKWFEPRGIDGVNIALLSDAERTELLAKMQKHKISASSLGSPVGKVNLEEDFTGHFEQFRRVIDTAEFLGAKYIRIFSFYHDGEGEWLESEREEVFARLSRMIEYAKERNIVLLHENEKDVYGDTVARCVDLMKNLSCEHFKAVFDPANFVQCGEDTWNAYEQLKPYIAYMHIKDADKDGNVVPAGCGEGHVEEILKDLFKSGYDGFLSLEPHLGSFVGLGALEKDDKMLQLEKSSEEKFIHAYKALKSILERV